MNLAQWLKMSSPEVQRLQKQQDEKKWEELRQIPIELKLKQTMEMLDLLAYFPVKERPLPLGFRFLLQGRH